MNKRINTHLALIIILFLATGVTIYTLSKSHAVESDISYSPIKNTAKIVPMKQTQHQNACQTKAFEGSAEVEVWKTEKNGKTILKASLEDMAKLPKNNSGDFQLIDPTPELEEKIEKSSENNPVKIKISGFASLCDGTYLASLEYKDGIFRPYIK